MLEGGHGGGIKSGQDQAKSTDDFRWPDLAHDIRLPSFVSRGEAAIRANAPPAFVPPAGDVLIDGMLSGLAWSSGALTFSFPVNGDFYEGSGGYATGAEQDQNFEAFNAAQQAAVLAFLASIASVTDLSFTLVEETADTHGDLRFAMSDAAEVAYAYLPSSSELGGDAWFNNTSGDFDIAALGSYAYMGILHEIGHALGLDHPFDPDVYGAIPLEWDSTEYTVMTYRSALGSDALGYTNAEFNFAQTLMMLDIAALQYMYGADFTYNASDTIYTWSDTTGEMFVNGVGQGAPGANIVFRTIWDGGGVDTYDFSNYADGVYIDLEPGYSSFTSGVQLALLDAFNGIFASGNVYNALLYNGDTRSLIENAIGGDGDDIFLGNSGDNTFSGNRGADYFIADLGADHYNGMAPGFTDIDIDVVSYELSTSAIGINTTTGVVSGAFVIGDTYFAVEGVAGTNFNDTISGFAYLFGLGGADTLNGGAGDDHVDGGDGDDILQSSEGRDDFIGGVGFDTVTYAAMTSSLYLLMDIGQTGTGDEFGDTFVGVEAIVGTSFSDTIFGNGAANTLNGASGDDHLAGGGGDDTLIAGTGADVLDGGSGFDIVSYADSSIFLGGISVVSSIGARFGEISDDTLTSIEGLIGTNANDRLEIDNSANYLDGLGGDDTLSGFGGNDTLLGGAGADNIHGGADNDSISGGDGADTLNGSTGDDTITGGAGADAIEGGSGVDVASYADSNEGVTISLTGVVGAGGHAQGDTLSGVERVTGSAFADVLLGSAEANILSGGAGIDSLQGGDGGDALNGGGGDDQINGGSGADAIDGGDGFDTVRYDGSATGVIIYVDAPHANTGEAAGDTLTSIEGFVGSTFNDYMVGGVANNVLQGFGDVDILEGHGGDDLLDGGDGDDALQGGLGGDILDGGAGFDSARYDGATSGVTIYVDAAYANVGEAAGDFHISIEGIVGSTFNDYLVGGVANNILQGFSGDDILEGHGGDDLLDGGDGNDQMNGGIGGDIFDGGAGFDTVRYDSATAGVIAFMTDAWANTGEATGDAYLSIEALYGSNFNDTLAGASNANELQGFDGTDFIYGYGGNDFVGGGDGNDFLEGGAGTDRLQGGAGNDQFIFRAGESNGDRVLDFAGNGAAVGDNLLFIGYGTAAQGATFTQLDATHWQITSADGLITDIVELLNGASIDPSDYAFVT